MAKTYLNIIGYSKADIDEHMHWQSDSFCLWYSLTINSNPSEDLELLQLGSPCPLTLFGSVPFKSEEEAQAFKDELFSIYSNDEYHLRGNWIDPYTSVDRTPMKDRKPEGYIVKFKEVDFVKEISKKRLTLVKEAYDFFHESNCF